MTTTYPVRITPAILAEYAAREPDAAVYRRIVADGGHWHDVTGPEAWELLDDAEFYVDPDGPGSCLTVGQRGAYRALARQLHGLGLDPADRITTTSTAAAADPPAPMVEAWQAGIAGDYAGSPSTAMRRPGGRAGYVDRVQDDDRYVFTSAGAFRRDEPVEVRILVRG